MTPSANTGRADPPTISRLSSSGVMIHRAIGRSGEAPTHPVSPICDRAPNWPCKQGRSAPWPRTFGIRRTRTRWTRVSASDSQRTVTEGIAAMAVQHSHRSAGFHLSFRRNRTGSAIAVSAGTDTPAVRLYALVSLRLLTGSSSCGRSWTRPSASATRPRPARAGSTAGRRRRASSVPSPPGPCSRPSVPGPVPHGRTGCSCWGCSASAWPS